MRLGNLSDVGFWDRKHLPWWQICLSDGFIHSFQKGVTFFPTKGCGSDLIIFRAHGFSSSVTGSSFPSDIYLSVTVPVSVPSPGFHCLCTKETRSSCDITQLQKFDPNDSEQAVTISWRKKGKITDGYYHWDEVLSSSRIQEGKHSMGKCKIIARLIRLGTCGVSSWCHQHWASWWKMTTQWHWGTAQCAFLVHQKQHWEASVTLDIFPSIIFTCR